MLWMRNDPRNRDLFSWLSCNLNHLKFCNFEITQLTFIWVWKKAKSVDKCWKYFHWPITLLLYKRFIKFVGYITKRISVKSKSLIYSKKIDWLYLCIVVSFLKNNFDHDWEGRVLNEKIASKSHTSQMNKLANLLEILEQSNGDIFVQKTVMSP